MVTWDPVTRAQAKPDGLLGLTHNGVSKLYVVELRHRTPTKLVIQQLYRDFRASSAILEKTGYQTPFDPFVLSVHIDRAVIETTQRRMAGHPAFQSVLKDLSFAYLPDLVDDFCGAWRKGFASPE